MLAAPLLRIAVRKGTITPLFCTPDKEFELAQRIIEEFEQSNKIHEKKSQLHDRVSAIESNYTDYKLVRGFYALLERRCIFSNSNIATNSENNTEKRKNAEKKEDGVTEIITMNRNAMNRNTAAPTINPITIRRMLFEESSKRGFALTDFERNEIMKSIAEKLHALSSVDIVKVMWSDLEENLVFDDFKPIDARTLIGWYNLSILQTLLFNSTKMDFYVAGGSNWKHVLRHVKRLGLMYFLEYSALPDQKNDSPVLVCSLEGPLSLFKLTERYGTLIAKLVPSIIFSSNEWHIDAWIVRKSMLQGKKLYQFKISNNSKEMPLFIDPFYVKGNNDNKNTSTVHQKLRLSSKDQFDSIVEEKFARKFQEVVAGATGWKMIREPDPLIVSGGKAFIPDFMFVEKYGKKVYLEIVGFWTPEYLERKIKKLGDILNTARKVNSLTSADDNPFVDLFIAINEDLVASMILPTGPLSSHIFSLIAKDKLIMYRNDSVPIKPILDHLKSLNKEILDRKVNDPNTKIEFDDTRDIVSVKEIAEKHNDVPLEVALKLVLRDYGDRYIESAGGQYLISQIKIEELKSLLTGVTKFHEACLLLLKNGIPEVCHADIIKKLGYDVLWQNLDPNTALLTRRRQPENANAS